MTHLQEVILQIAVDIDQLCREYYIPYFLDGGTALGAVRHQGFIPWDDDFDIIILPEYYDKFVDMCHNKLDKNKYKFIEAERDWPMHISKIKLKGTSIEEVDEYPMDDKGIYIDVFCFDYASNIKVIRFFQWICTRIWVTLMISTKPYTTHNYLKKILIKIAKLINHPPVRNLFRYLGRSHSKTDYLSMAWCRTRKSWSQYFCKKELFKNTRYIIFENFKFPINEEYDKYLTICFGNYMQLPPPQKRKGLHIKSVNFGKY